VTGSISKLLKQYLSKIPGKHEIKELQQTATAILGTVHTLRKVLMSQQKTYFTGETSVHCKYRTAATQYVYPKNIFCFRYIIVSTLHKGDKNNNNSNNNNNIRNNLLKNKGDLEFIL
jgi:hypothetical protein